MASSTRVVRPLRAGARYALLLLSPVLTLTACDFDADASGRIELDADHLIMEREREVTEHMRSLDSDGLRDFLQRMPKGADLHNHTSGAISTEKLIAWGREDGACVHPDTLVASNPCAEGAVSLDSAEPGNELYQRVLAAWSMAGFEGPLLEAHEHFFAAFGKFSAIQTDARNADSYADVLGVAGRNNQLYIELLQGFGSGAGATIARELTAKSSDWDESALLALREKIVAHAMFAPAIEKQAQSIADTLSGSRSVMACEGDAPDPGCAVDVRLLVSANRTGTREAVFGQWVFAYELAQRVPEVVGVNLVSPEEHENSLAFYDDEMFALGVLGDWNDNMPDRKKVHVSLHAGELIPEVLPDDKQDHLTFHIRRAVDVAHAERIGHGVDVSTETDGDGVDDLLQDMRATGTMVEICLTSNRVLLGVSGEQHPFGRYRESGVPLALATDDQGILRGDISQEYLAGATDQRLDYPALKQLARTSVEHAFAPGASLWRSADDFSVAVSACADDRPELSRVSKVCSEYLRDNTRAGLQWKLERQLAMFEEQVAMR